MLYLDSSAAAKLYIVEMDASVVQRAVALDSDVVTARITFVEVHSALDRARRAGRLLDLPRALNLFQADWASYAKIDVDGLLLADAARFVHLYALRGYDAVHLAAATDARLTNRGAVTFAAFDGALNRAAAAEGFPLL